MITFMKYILEIHTCKYMLYNRTVGQNMYCHIKFNNLSGFNSTKCGTLYVLYIHVRTALPPNSLSTLTYAGILKYTTAMNIIIAANDDQHLISFKLLF